MRGAARLLFAVTALPFLALAVAMFVCFSTWNGRLFALTSVGIWLLLGQFLFRAQLNSVALALMAACCVVIVVASPWMAQPHQPTLKGSVGSYNPGFDWTRWHPANLIPESDWAELGVRFLYPRERSQRLLPVLRPLYQEMASVGGYSGLGNVLPATAADLLGLGTGAPHYYYFRPEGVGPFPVVYFMHGAMGNFKSYLYFWQRWAAPRGWAVVCPTFGYGSWYHPGGEEAAEAALTQSIKDQSLDSNRVVVVALSNGATGAVRLLRRRPDLVNGMLLVSTVLDVEQFGSESVLEWSKTHPPIRVMEGDRDINVLPERVGRRVEQLRSLGLKVDYRLLPGYDHHMMFEAKAETYAELELVAEPSKDPKDRL